MCKTRLKKKQKQLKSLGQGNRPNAADPLSDEDINHFYDRKVLGTNSPRALLNTVWLNNCIHFGMRPGKEQRDLRWGDLELKQDSEGTRFIEFCRERQTKTRTGENPRNLRSKKPQMYENKSNPDRCPINSYLAYRARRPAGMLADESPFYLAVNIEVPKSEEQQWYKCSPLGVNSLRNMLKRMVEDSGLETDKKLVNHSTRKHLVQKLVDNDIPPTEIMQITGHKNVASINNYSTLSDRKQQQISGLLSGASAVQTASNSVKSHSVSIDEQISTSTSFLPVSSTNMPTGSLFQSCQIGTVNVYPSGVPTKQQLPQLCSQKRKRRRIITLDSSDSSQSQ